MRMIGLTVTQKWQLCEPRANSSAAMEDRLLSVLGLKLVLSLNIPRDITS